MDRNAMVDHVRDMVADGLCNVVDSVLGQPPAIAHQPDPDSQQRVVQDLIAAASKRVVWTSAGGSVIPGPLGMLNVVPSLLSVTRDQLCLVRDVATACGHRSDDASRNMVLGVMAVASGSAQQRKAVFSGQQPLTQLTGLPVRTLCLHVAGNLSLQVMATVASRWVPAIGPAALGAWSGYSTRKMGQAAHRMFTVKMSGTSMGAAAHMLPVEAVDPGLKADDANDALELCKLQALIGLARVDGRLSAQELAYINQQLAAQPLSEAQRARFQELLDGSTEALQGLETLAASPNASIGLLSSLAALAYRDGELHPAERMYILRIGALLGFERADVVDLLEVACQGRVACGVSVPA